MKTLLLIPLLTLSACKVRQPTMVDNGKGARVTTGMSLALGGKQYERITVSKDGAIAITTRDDQEKSFSDGATAGLTAYGFNRTAAVSLAEVGRDRAIALGAQKAGVEGQRIAADQAVSLGEQALKQATTIPK